MKKIITSILLIFLVLISMLCLSEIQAGKGVFGTEATNTTTSPNLAGDVIWSKNYGGNFIDYGRSVVQTSDGGFAFAGGTQSFGAGNNDFWLIKTDSEGNQLWNKTYGGPSSDAASSVIQTFEGGYALAGITYSFGAGDQDFWLVKTDSAGNKLWNKTYGGPNLDSAKSLVQTSDGGYAIVGYTYSFGDGLSDFWLVKTDSEGNQLWNKTYGGTSSESAYSIFKTSDNGFAVAGSTSSFGAGLSDFWLVKTDSFGNQQWNKTYGGTNSDSADTIIQTNDGGYALSGLTWSFGSGSGDFWLVKTDSAGYQLWNKTYGGTGYDSATAMVQTIEGGYAIAGDTQSFGAGNWDFWLVKTDLVGKQLWNKTYGGTDSDMAQSIVQANDGGYILAGDTDSFGTMSSDDFWLVKVSSGNLNPELMPGTKIQANGADLRVNDVSTAALSTFVVDWNNDGKKDLLVGTYSPGYVYLFLNTDTDSTPTFGTSTRIKEDGNDLQVADGAASIFVIDWNNDGKKDLLMGSLGIVYLYTNIGTDSAPLFSAASKTTLVLTETTIFLTDIYAQPFVIDWNNDGKKDLIVGHNGWLDHAYIALYLNTGSDASPTFGTPTHVQANGTPISRSYGSSPFVVDWNGDGKKDLIVREGNVPGRGPQITYYENIGTDAAPQFGQGVAIRADGQNIAVSIGDGSSMFSVVDWNNDGSQDIVIGDYDGYVWLYLSHPVSPTPPLTVSITPNQVVQSIGTNVTLAAATSGGSGSYVDYSWHWTELSDNRKGSYDSGATNTLDFPSSISTPGLGFGCYNLYVVVTDSFGQIAQSNIAEVNFPEYLNYLDPNSASVNRPTGIACYGTYDYGGTFVPFTISTNEVSGYADIESMNIPITNLLSPNASLQLNVMLNVTTSSGPQVYWLQNVMELCYGSFYFANNIWNATSLGASFSSNSIQGTWPGHVENSNGDSYYVSNTLFSLNPQSLVFPSFVYLVIRETLDPNTGVSIQFSYVLSSSLIPTGTRSDFDIVTLTIPNAQSAEISVDPFSTTPKYGTFYNTELVWGGPNNGQDTNVDSLVANMGLFYRSNIGLQPFPAVYSFGFNTRETTDNLQVSVASNGDARVVSGQTNNHFLTNNFNPSINYVSVGAITLGSASIDHSEITGVKVDITGVSTIIGGVGVASQKLASQPVGTGLILSSDSGYIAFYDVKVAGISDGTARISIVNSGVSSVTSMRYWDGAEWTDVSALIVLGNTISGNIAVSALTGTPIVLFSGNLIIQAPTPTPTPSPTPTQTPSPTQNSTPSPTSNTNTQNTTPKPSTSTSTQSPSPTPAIPEYPFAIILALFAFATLAVTAAYRRKQ